LSANPTQVEYLEDSHVDGTDERAGIGQSTGSASRRHVLLARGAGAGISLEFMRSQPFDIIRSDLLAKRVGALERGISIDTPATQAIAEEVGGALHK